MILSFLMLMLFAATMITAALKDASTMKIPNWVSLAVLGAFFLAIPFAWQGWGNFGEHMAVGGTMFLLGLVLFAPGWLGGGDAKLLAATAFWWTWTDLLYYITYTTLAGGVIALFILIGRKYIPVQVMTMPWMHTMFRDQTKMPYGLALAFGALATLPQSNIFQYAAGLG
ncbi:prepilin peptidase [Fretibacter rubidus]|uniref:A24 family peptidase n=1 Tax=Fretibacter rubidus TaxID=570162 RepID=UPI003529FCA2